MAVAVVAVAARVVAEVEVDVDVEVDVVVVVMVIVELVLGVEAGVLRLVVAVAVQWAPGANNTCNSVGRACQAEGVVIAYIVV